MHKLLALATCLGLAACGLDDAPPRYAGARGDTGAQVAALRARAARGEGPSAAAAREVALAALWSALRAPAPEARIAAIEAVERLEIEPLAEAIAERMGDDDEVVQVAAAAALLRSHPDAVTVVGDGLKASDPEVRRRAVAALGKKGGAAAVTVIAAMAEDPAPGVRAAVLAALPADAVVEVARARLGDPEGAVRTAALRALLRARTAEAADGARARALIKDPYLGARLAALDLAARLSEHAWLASPEALADPYVALRVGVLLAREDGAVVGARAIDAAGRSPDWPLRAAALNALVDVVPRRSAEFAAAFARDPVPEVRLAAARALAKLGDEPRARAMLLELLAGPSGLDAALELARRDDAQGLAAVHARFADGDVATRVAILREAAVLPDADAVLLDGAKDPSPLARVVAAEQLWRRAR